MAKYYIESGDVSFVVSACDAEGAALWAMHRVIDGKINDWESLGGESVFTDGYSRQIEGVPAAIPYEAMLDGLAEFDTEIRLSERGFGYDEAGCLETETIFHTWRQLMMAVDRLHEGK